MRNVDEQIKQTNFLLEQRKKAAELEKKQIDEIGNVFFASGYYIGINNEKAIRVLLHKYGFEEVLTAAEIARDKYIIAQNRGISFAIDKIGGICYNRANHIGRERYGH